VNDLAVYVGQPEAPALTASGLAIPGDAAAVAGPGGTVTVIDRDSPTARLMEFAKINGQVQAETVQRVVDMVRASPSETVEVLQKVLTEQANYEVRIAHSGFSCGVECEKFRPHVLLVDMHLGDINGETVLGLVRDNSDLQLTKIIAMSGKLTDGQAQHLLNNGFDGYLKKPFHVRQVIESIEDATAVVY